MFKKIIIGNKEVDFKCSAATSILYKRLFGKSLTEEVSALAKMSQNAFKLKDKWESMLAEITEETTDEEKEKRQQEIVELLASDDSLTQMASMTENLTPQMAYIMWLEANKPQREVFAGLTDEAYLLWLSSFDKSDLSDASSELLGLWNSSNKQNSKLKN
jgi:hypothetical protein